MEHITQIRVHWADTDSARIAHHMNFFRWFEEAEIELFRDSGKTRKQLVKETQTSTPRLKVQCEFFSPVYEDDLLEIRTTVLKITEKTYHYRHEVHRPADGAHLATGEVIACCVIALDDGTYKSHPIPEEMAAALKKYRGGGEPA